ncbi:hypothetical protein Pelo_19298 [Pelomyxa schiedti]|nr:hypothetical protein Pelo_19298 [Pelomyxa schiedti]
MPTRLMCDSEYNVFLILRSYNRSGSAVVINAVTGNVVCKYTGTLHVVDDQHLCLSDDTQSHTTRVYNINDLSHPVCEYPHTTVTAGCGFLLISRQESDAETQEDDDGSGSCGHTFSLMDAMSGVKMLSFTTAHTFPHSWVFACPFGFHSFSAQHSIMCH